MCTIRINDVSLICKTWLPGQPEEAFNLVKIRIWRRAQSANQRHWMTIRIKLMCSAMKELSDAVKAKEVGLVETFREKLE